ncbi:MAG: serine hydrolase domain-containing protein [Bacteroidota bacterium]
MQRTLYLILLACLLACQTTSPSTTIPPDLSADAETVLSNLSYRIQLKDTETPRWTVEERMAHHKIPGVSIAFFEDGEIIWTKSYGYADVEGKRLVDENTRFQAASISKPVAASAMMQMVQNGQLDLDKPVNEYLTSWKLTDNAFTQSKDVNLRRIVSHTAGLTVHGFRGYAKGEDVPTTTQVLDGAEPANSDQILTDTFPGSMYRYSGGGYTLMQLLLEDVSGKDFTTLMGENVLAKIGMANSAYSQPLRADWQGQEAYGYRGNGDMVEGKWHTYPEKAAAGLWTTPTDLAKFAIAVQEAWQGDENQFISPDIAKQMLTTQLPAEDHGLGPSLQLQGDTIWFGHGGANEGFRCMLFSCVNNFKRQGMAVMTNSDNGSNLFMEIFVSAAEQYGWNVFTPKVKDVIDLTAEEQARFAGKYRFTDEYIFDIVLEDGGLAVIQHWNDAHYPIYPEKPLEFFDLADDSHFSFKADASGNIISVSDGPYTAEKVE